MIILQDNITSIIPQRPPFVMIDQLLSCDETYANTTFKITAENVLVDNGQLSEAGIIENIAQTAAAGFGYFTAQSNAPIMVGYIAAIKNLEVYSLPQIGDVIDTNITVINKVFDVTIVNGSIKCRDVLIAKCEMKMYIKK